MHHRLHKAVVPSTNKQDLVRDLMSYENDMQGLRFALEEEMDQDPQRSGGLCELARIGMMESVYFDPSDDLLGRGVTLVNLNLDTDFSSGDERIVGVRCPVRPLSALQLSRRSPLLSSQLSKSQLTELYNIRVKLGNRIVLTSTKVTFFDSVSYFVRRHPEQSSVVSGSSSNNRTMIQKIKIRTGDIIELGNAPAVSSHDSQFGRVLVVMVHEQMVFLIVSWILPTQRVHPRLRLREFEEMPLFYYPAFQPLTLVDHPSLINSTHFARLDGKVYMNTYIFSIV